RSGCCPTTRARIRRSPIPPPTPGTTSSSSRATGSPIRWWRLRLLRRLRRLRPLRRLLRLPPRHLLPLPPRLPPPHLLPPPRPPPGPCSAAASGSRPGAYSGSGACASARSGAGACTRPRAVDVVGDGRQRRPELLGQADPVRALRGRHPVGRDLDDGHGPLQ